jgi:hypothetical protein
MTTSSCIAALREMQRNLKRAFRQDRRFQPFATKLGLMAYWQKYEPPDACDLQGAKLTCH